LVCPSKSREKGRVSRVTIQGIPMKVEVVFQPIPEDDDRTVVRQPKLSAESHKVSFADRT
jgi:hypothetical protein